MLRPLALLLLLMACILPARAQQVVDSTTGQGIAGATVMLDGRVVPTDSEGHFADDATASHVQARAPGYRAVSLDHAAFRQDAGTVRLTPFHPKALYLSFYGVGSQTIRNAALSLIRDANLNALVIDVKGDRGLIAYRSDIPLARTVGAQSVTTIPDLPALLKSLRARGIYTIARIVTFKDDALAAARPDLAIKLANGKVFRDRENLAWADPMLKDVRDYDVAVAVEAARAGFDEIQFDYLRFPDAPRGIAFAKPTTQASRLDAITMFLSEARRALAPYNVYLAADIFGYVCWNPTDTGIGQRLEQIMPLVDYLSPMLYPSGFQFGIPGYRNPVAHPYEIVRLSLDRARARLGVAPVRFRPWLQAFKDYAFDRRTFEASEVTAQIRAAADFGTDGYMLWNPRNNYGGIGLAVEQVEPDARATACF